jgi:hypothetical protein
LIATREDVIMPRSGLFLEATISLMNSLGQTALANMRVTQEELRTDTFSLSRAVGRAASFWLEAAEALPTAFVASANGPMPTLFVVVHDDDTSVTRTVTVIPPENRELEFTGLNQVGGTDSFDPGTVRVEPTGPNTAINLILENLGAHRPRPGLYQGIVHVGDAVLALIMVNVVATAKVAGKARGSTRKGSPQ